MGDEVMTAAVLAPPPPPPLPVDEAMVDATAVSGDVKIEGHENGNVVVGVAEAVVEEGQEQPPVDENAPTSEEERLWSAVKENAADFNSWTVLIQETEKMENLARIEKVYDAFLAEFPLCYGYWKKYADHEAKLGSPEKIVEVYERAVKAVTYSVDIWMHYCTYAMEKFDSPEKIRSFSSCTSFAVSAKRWSHVGGALSFHFIG